MAEPAPIEQMWSDFNAAMVRAERGRTDEDETRRGFNELMLYLYMLHERLRADDGYQHALTASPDGETVKALVLVRGAAVHRGVASFAHVPLVASPRTAPSVRLAPGKNWQWLPTIEVAADLPKPGAEKVPGNDDPLICYQAHLDGRAVLGTFDIAFEFFQRRLGVLPRDVGGAIPPA